MFEFSSENHLYLSAFSWFSSMSRSMKRFVLDDGDGIFVRTFGIHVPNNTV